MRRMQDMMESMQGMMEHMQGMTEDMQSMMGRRGMMGRMGRMGRSGMMGHMRGMMRHGGMFLRHLERLTQQLDLTDEQETQVRSRVRTHMKDAIRVKADLEIKTIDLHNLLETEPMDLPKVKELLHAIASQKADLHFAHITLKQEIGKLLTPEQQKKFRSMRRHMMRGHDGMMGHGSMMGQEGMMRRRGMRGTGGMRNPCGMMGRGAGNR